MSTYWYGATVQQGQLGKIRTFLRSDEYNQTYSYTQSKITVGVGVQAVTNWKGGYKCSSSLSETANGNKWKTDATVPQLNAGTHYSLQTHTFYVTRTHKTAVYHITGHTSHATSSGDKTIQFTVPARPSYAVKYVANTPQGTATNMPSSQTKWYGETLRLSKLNPKLSGYTFTGWNTKDDGTGTSYAIGANYTGNSALTLYAMWRAGNVPTLGETTLSYSGTMEDGNIVKGFTTVVCEYKGAGATGSYDVVLKIGSLTSSAKHTANGTISYLVPLSATDGEEDMYLVITDDSVPARTYKKYLGTQTISSPKWETTFTIPIDDSHPLPNLTDGNPSFVTFQAYRYSDSTWVSWTTSTLKATVNENSWSFPLTFDYRYVSDSTSSQPDASIRFSYVYYDTVEKEYRIAFFSSSRNQNFSNGIYNVMFVGGVEDKPDYSSRVWWSAVNNPLYFPDTNYLDVGSNDTKVQGLTKVGNYLGVIKQSKTTDTAIYLVYPTSFDENATYAVKQGVQGIGAISRYAFNILRDETLFLSPRGIMAITPTNDEEHSVQNRSYYIDGKLLAEENLDSAYSFVYDGKYYLAINGHCYVLDGNQRNSWGNDRTNLVYECYYLDNIPATCFAKFNDALIFANENEVCRFKDRSEGSFTDAYNSGEENVPVSAEWSTIADDDGSLNYYKTMQKKGNIVSVLPTENQLSYMAAQVSETDFNEDKTLYFTEEDGKYIRCTEESVYDEEETYYVEHRSATRVFVRKDNGDEIEILRKFSLSSELPSEMVLRKKVKKYKRLQFILRNDGAEDFGVDQIVKSYMLKSYTKK